MLTYILTISPTLITFPKPQPQPQPQPSRTFEAKTCRINSRETKFAFFSDVSNLQSSLVLLLLGYFVETFVKYAERTTEIQ